MRAPYDLLAGLPAHAELAFIQLVDKLDLWLEQARSDERGEARHAYAQILRAFLDEHTIDFAHLRLTPDGFANDSHWWTQLARDVTSVKARCILRAEGGDTPPPNADLSEDVRKDYDEARAILVRSPRGSAALLRLCIQKICVELGEPGKNLNEDIKSLVKKGLPLRVQQAFDVIRINANNAVHPGELNLSDTVESTRILFSFVNFIAERMVSQEKAIDLMFDQLTPEQRAAITKRDQTPKAESD
jgi:hypothetical protein